MRVPRLVLPFVGALLGAIGAGCSTDDSGASTATVTRMVLSPASFLGDVACSGDEGALQSYVVTLYAWSDAADPTPFTVGSSYPTPCSRSVTFQTLVVPGQLYTAEVDGYDRPAAELEPFGGVSSGAREMLDAETGESAAPRWTTACGGSAVDGVTAVEFAIRSLPACEPLADAAPTPAAISFPLQAALGPAPCDVATEATITPEGSSLPAATAVACDAEPLLYTDGVVAGRGYYFYVTASSAEASYGTECFVTAKAGTTVSPLCNPLATTGTAVVRLAALEVEGAPLCPEGSRFELVLADGTLLSDASLPCLAQAQVGPLAPGPLAFSARVLDAQGTPTGATASCTADVLAGKAVDALCVP